MSEQTISQWNISEILQYQNCNFAIILLNQPILNCSSFVTLWNKASIRIVVDGGGNQWNEIRKTFSNISYPDIVTGDFDSIESEVLDAFKGREGIRVMETPNQDETDFTKALRILQQELEGIPTSQPAKVVAYCEISGRFDQVMANIETLFHATKILPTHQLFLMGSTSVIWLLPPGTHQVQFGELVVPYCSLIPVGSTCSTITTKGLRWNLTNDKLAFGHLISTSNEIAQDNIERVVHVENSDPILFSMERGDLQI